MIHDFFFAGIGMMSQWANFALMAGAIILSAIIASFVALSFRKRKRRKRKHRHREDAVEQPRPTLAQTGGLPPRRNVKSDLQS